MDLWPLRPEILGGHDLILGLAFPANLNNRGSRKRFWELGTVFRRILAPSRAPFQLIFLPAASRRFASSIPCLCTAVKESRVGGCETVSSVFTVFVRSTIGKVVP